MTEAAEYAQVKIWVDTLMTGGPFGGGIGPGQTAYKVNEKFGTNYRPEEIWRIWRQGKEWANPADDVYE